MRNEYPDCREGNLSRSARRAFARAVAIVAESLEQRVLLSSPEQVVFLSDLIPTGVVNGWGAYEKDRSNGENGPADGHALTLAGVTYAKGLGVHAYSSLKYDLTADSYTRFQSAVGVDDEVGNYGSVVFQVFLDNALAWQSSTLRGSSPTSSVDLNLYGKSTLELRAIGTSDGIGCDHADWAGARLLSLAVPDTLAPTPNPSGWTVLPHAVGHDAISMEAANASDPSGVLYYFERLTTGLTVAKSSGWQDSPVWIDTGLDPTITWGYRVRTCDKSPAHNDTAWSSIETAYPTWRHYYYLGELTPAADPVNGWGPYERDRSNGEFASGDGKTITLNGHTYGRGLGVHADSILKYDLSGLGMTRFTTDVGVDDEVTTGGSVVFEVWLDGVLAKRTAKLTSASPTQPLVVDIAGKKTLELRVTSAGDGNARDHADWAAAMIDDGTVTSAQTTFLSDLVPSTNPINGFGDFERDRSNGNFGPADGRTITLNGQTYTKGLGVHAESVLTYSLLGYNGAGSRFQTDIGVDDEVINYGSVVFQVWLDGIQVYDSGRMTGASGTKQLDIQIVGKSTLELRVTSAGDGIACDHADWAGARLYRPTGKPDLTMNSVSLGVTTEGGTPIMYYLDYSGTAVEQSGGLPVGASAVGFRISTDTKWDAGDLPLATSPFPAGPGTFSSTVTIGSTDPFAGMPPGIYYILAKADALNQVDEQNEYNNVASSYQGVGIDRTISVNLASQNGPLPTTFQVATSGGRAAEGLGEVADAMGLLGTEWRDQLQTVHDELGFEYIRVHGLLCDDMGVYSEAADGTPQYDFTKVDVLFDFLKDIGMRPFVELSFMPEDLASDGNKDYTPFPGWTPPKAIVTMPKDIDKWGDLIEELTRHLVTTYTAETVQQWYFEVWNEPDIWNFLILPEDDQANTGETNKFNHDKRLESYLELYGSTVRAIDRGAPGLHLNVGGPAFAAVGDIHGERKVVIAAASNGTRQHFQGSASFDNAFVNVDWLDGGTLRIAGGPVAATFTDDGLISSAVVPGSDPPYSVSGAVTVSDGVLRWDLQFTGAVPSGTNFELEARALKWVERMEQFVDHCQTSLADADPTNDARYDFISFHRYASGGFIDPDGTAQIVLKPLDDWPDSVKPQLDKYADFDLPSTPEVEHLAIPIHLSEWGTSASSRDPIHDAFFQAPWILDQIKSVNDHPQLASMPYWTFTDIFYEVSAPPGPFHGGFGLVTVDGIRKPSYFAFSFLNQLSETELKDSDANSWATTTGDGRDNAQVLLWDLRYPDGLGADKTPQDDTDNEWVSNQEYFVDTANLAKNAETLPPVAVHVSGLTPGVYRMEVRRVGYRANDAYTAYLDMGGPATLNPTQVAGLKAQATGAPEYVEWVTVGSDGVFRRAVDMRELDSVLLTLQKAGT